jgi:hypothetical protein
LLYLGLLSRKCTGVVAEIVGLGMVCFDCVKEEVAGMGKKRVNAEREAVEVGRKWVGGYQRIGLDRGNRVGLFEGSIWRWSG